MRHSILAITPLLCLVAACSTMQPPKVAAALAPVETVSTAPANPSAASPAPQADTSDAQALAARLNAQRASLNADSVYFDFDSAVVKSQFEAMLHQQADFTTANASDRLALQGNTDERGGAEYNLALGQKRAEAVRKALIEFGAPADRIEATSFGSEKPKATCHDESCWSLNRRVDFAHAR